jgi:hypothetical protein
MVGLATSRLDRALDEQPHCMREWSSTVSLKWGMFKPQHLAENRSKCGTSHFLQVAGFVAIFNGANYPNETSLQCQFL